MNNNINEINKKINFIKLIILLSIKHQLTNKVDIYKFFTKGILKEIKTFITFIKEYEPKNETDKIYIFLQNYSDLLNLLNDIITNIINLKSDGSLILNDTNGIDLDKTKNPAKRYLNFINLTFNLVQKLYNLVPSHIDRHIKHVEVKRVEDHIDISSNIPDSEHITEKEILILEKVDSYVEDGLHFEAGDDTYKIIREISESDLISEYENGNILNTAYLGVDGEIVSISDYFVEEVSNLEVHIVEQPIIEDVIDSSDPDMEEGYNPKDHIITQPTPEVNVIRPAELGTED